MASEFFLGLFICDSFPLSYYLLSLLAFSYFFRFCFAPRCQQTHFSIVLLFKKAENEFFVVFNSEGRRKVLQIRFFFASQLTFILNCTTILVFALSSSS